MRAVNASTEEWLCTTRQLAVLSVAVTLKFTAWNKRNKKQITCVILFKRYSLFWHICSRFVFQARRFKWRLFCTFKVVNLKLITHTYVIMWRIYSKKSLLELTSYELSHKQKNFFRMFLGIVCIKHFSLKQWQTDNKQLLMFYTDVT